MAHHRTPNIRYIKNKDIDKVKWDCCIESSPNSRVYAQSWYLDYMSENWDAIIMDDYQAVMPLPWKSKLGFKYIYHPEFIQQLGLFGETLGLDIKIFLDNIPNNFLKIDYFFGNNPMGLEVKSKINFVIDLNKKYKEIASQYKDSLKRNIKSCEKENCSFKELTIDSIPLVISMYRNAYQSYYPKFNDLVFSKFSKLMHYAIQNNIGFIYSVHLENGNMGAVYFVIDDGKRIYYLLGAPSEVGKKNKCIPFLISEIIKLNAESTKIFDFEGSEIKSVAKFYEKFSPRVEKYFYYKTYQILGIKL